MKTWRKFRNRLRALLRKAHLDKDMDAEIRSHLEMRASENVAAGMNSEEARTKAMRQFGRIEAIKEICRDQRGVSWIENAMQDFRYGVRALCKNPGFASTAIMTIAIGIGSCTALFSVVNGVLLRPLHLPKPEQVVAISETVPPNNQSESVTPAAYLDWVKQNSVFAHVAVLRGLSFTTKLDGKASYIGGLSVSANYFSVLGIQPILGRGFLADEESPGKDHVTVLSYREWQNHFGGSEKINNQTLNLDDQPYTIVGVLPEANIPWNAPLFTPMAFSAADRNDYGSHGLTCVGRLKPGITMAQAQADMTVVSDRIARAHPKSNLGHGASVVSLLENITGNVRLQLMILLSAVAFLLLIACVNVASLLLARAHSRQKEIAVRSALGASRGRIIRQFIIEGLLVAVSGGVLGGMLAYASLGLVSRFSSQYVPRTSEISLDPSVLCVTAGLMLLVGIGVGLVPALQFSRGDLAEPLKDSGRSSSTGRKPQRLRACLVTAEIALAMILLVGTGLLARSLVALQHADQGFKTDDVFVTSLSFGAKKYETRERLLGFMNDAVAQVSALPNVSAVAFADDMPMVNFKGLLFSVVGAPEVPVRNLPDTSASVVSPNYFRAMSIPLQQGRDFSARDAVGSPRVVIINQQLARVYFPGVNPIGRRLMIYTMANEPDVEREIIGVVGDVRPFGPQSGIEAQVYEPLAQIPQRGLTLVVKSAGPSRALPSEVMNIVHTLDPDTPFFWPG